MWTENERFRKDMEAVTRADFVDWDALAGKTVFVTGATGLIGYYLVSSLLYRNLTHGSGIRVIALVRDTEKAERQYRAQLAEPGISGLLRFAEGELEKFPEISEEIDYIIHGGGPTASAYFVEHPVETVETVVMGTRHVLELAKEKRVKKVTFLSSIEAYGIHTTDDALTEKDFSGIDPMNVRNSYPAAKVLAENLCAGYDAEYGVPANVVRLTQTMGPGIAESDQRVFAYFIRSLREKKDIILQTKGGTKHVYLYLSDAATAILTVLLSGEAGRAYNAANDETYCSIYEMAKLVAEELGNREIGVEIQTSPERAAKYPPEVHLFLDTTRLRNLGWRWQVGLREMFEAMR